MKNIKSILNHTFPKNSKLDEHRCFNKILSLFPQNLKKHILFCYKRDKTLFFVLDHPAIKMEFNYNQKLINELLNLAKTKIEECKEIKFNSFKTFISNKTLPKKVETKKIDTYFEKSNGNFSIYSENSEIRSIFEKIRDKIKEIKENGE